MIPYQPWPSNSEEALKLFEQFEKNLSTRRSVREYSSAPVSKEQIEALLSLAASAPSGANKQPWHFVAVQDPEVKRQIREAAEEEEKAFYGGRASEGSMISSPLLRTGKSLFWKMPLGLS